MGKNKYANDPQATIKQRRKNREKARLKADKLISDVALKGGYAITGLGAIGIAAGYKGLTDTRNKIDSLKKQKEYFNSKRSKMMQKPRRVDIQSPDMK